MTKTLEDKRPLIGFNKDWNDRLMNQIIDNRKNTIQPLYCIECGGINCYSNCIKYN